MTTLDLPVLLDLARTVTAAAEHHFHGDGPGTIRAKGDRDMVSDTDLTIELQIRAALREATPNFGFLGEEEGEDLPGASTRWILDPVDGTANFIRGMPLCGISLALVHEDAEVLGVIALPYLRHRYWAATGLGAWRDGERIHPASTATLGEAMVAIGGFTLGRGDPDRDIALLTTLRRLAEQAQRTRMIGTSAVDLVMVADGGFEASVTLGNCPWDMAAGVVIARESGALVTDLDGTVHTIRSRTTIAAAPGVHAELLQLIRDTVTGTRFDPATWAFSVPERC